MAGRGKFKGWIDRADVDPDLLERFDRFRERVAAHLKGSLPSGNGTADTLGAHRRALADIPLTLREQEILRRVRSKKDEGRFGRDETASEPAETTDPEYDPDAALLAVDIDPNLDVFLNVSIGDPEDPTVRVWGTEYVNRITGVRKFVETHREQLPERHTHEQMKRDPRYKRMGRT